MILAVLSLLPAYWSPVLPATPPPAVVTQVQEIKPKPCTPEIQKLIDAALAEKDTKVKIEKLRAALSAARAAKDRQGEGCVLHEIGEAKWGQYDRTCLDDFAGADAIFSQTGDDRRRSWALSWKGSVLYNLGEYRAALATYEEALPLMRRCGEIAGAGGALNDMGLIYAALGEKQAALARLSEALPLRRICGDTLGEARTLVNIGSVFSSLGELRAALAKYHEALPLLRKCGDVAGEAATLTNIGAVYADLGDLQAALAMYEEAMPLHRRSGDVRGEGATMDNIGLVYSALGDKRAAIEKYEEALPLRRKCGDVSGEAATLNNIGSVYADLGEKKTALARHAEALPLVRKVGDIAGEATTLASIGRVYLDLGDWQAARDKCEVALPLFRKCGDIAGEATTLNNIGRICSELGDQKAALAKYEEALPLFRKHGSLNGEALTLHNIGAAYRQLGDAKTAIAKFEESLPLLRKSGNIRLESATLTNIGVVYSDLGDKKTALAKYEEALPLRRKCGDIAGEALTLNNIGAVMQDPANPAPATIFYKLSVNLKQQLRANAPESLLATFTSTVETSYTYLADSLARQERFAESLKVANMLKGTELYGYTRRDEGALSILKERIPLTKKEAAWIGGYEKIGTSLGEMGTEHEKLRQLGEKNRDAAQEKRFQELTKLLEAKQAEFQMYLKTALKEFAKPERPEGMASVESLNSDLLELQESTGQTAVALNYALAEKSGSVILSLPGASPKGASIDKTREEINKKALALWQKLQDPTSDPIPEASELYDLLIRPVEKDFPKDTKVLMLSLQSGLLYVPFAALYDKETKQWLGEKYQSVIFTTKSRSRWNLDPKKDGTVVALGSSKARSAKVPGEERSLAFNALPGVPEEAHAADPKALLDENFSRAAWERVLTDRGRTTIHLATHCQLGVDNASTFILLGDGSLFALSELKDEKSSLSFAGVDLLVLSACQTAVGDGDGTELEGFAAVCEMKGARAVLASQWKVDDTATQRLMKRFYALRAEHKDWTKLACLNQATKDLRDGKLGAKGDAQDRSGTLQPPPTGSKWKGTPWSHPYYWAPFVLFGNWK